MREREEKKKNKNKSDNKNKNKNESDNDNKIIDNFASRFDKVSTTNTKSIKELKSVDIDKLNEGFKLLPKTIPINMIFGNHDLEKVKQTEANNNRDCIVTTETEAAVKYNTPNIELNTFHSKVLENNTLLLMIDTSIYSKKPEEYIDCYNEFEKSNNNAQVAQVAQLNKISDAINNCNLVQISNLIICGHHPIIAVKHKNEMDTQIHDLIDFENVLLNIRNLINTYNNNNNPETKYYYLTADVHLYQHGIVTITPDKPKLNAKSITTHNNPKLDTKSITTLDNSPMEIDQYIVGTGGTNLDENPIGYNGEYNNLNLSVKYEIKESIKNYGFLDCIIKNQNHDIEFNFIQLKEKIIGDEKSIGGKRNKSRKSRKSRKLSIRVKNNGKKSKKTKKMQRYM